MSPFVADLLVKYGIPTSSRSCYLSVLWNGKDLALNTMGAEYGHNVKVVLGFGGRKVVFFARHVNRLSDAVIRLNDGNPLHVIEVRRKEVGCGE